MSLFFRRAVEESRAVTSLPWSHGGDSPTSEGSLEGALSLIPVYAAVRLISDDIATLPLQRYRKTSTGRLPLPLPALLESPSNSGTEVDWLSRYMTSQLLRGNAYGLLVGADGDSPGLPSMIEWLNPDKVHPVGQTDWIYDGHLVSGSKILHIPAMVLPGSRVGISPMTAARLLVQAGMEGQKFQNDWYRNKGIPSLIAKNVAKTLDPTAAASAKERLRATMRSGEPFVTGNDWDIEAMKLSADDAGFVTSAKLTATQIASIYGIPPEKIGGETGRSLTYSTRDQNALDYVSSLNPWLVRFEKAISKLLPRPQYVKFNVDGLIRADVKTRYAVHQIARTIGLKSIDELRATEDLEPLPDGAGQDYTPLKVAPTPAPQEAP